ncbi:MAG: hypothetical protein ABI067_06975 [Leifsonia sp.]
MQYLINGSNLETIYGIKITNAVVPFFAFPERKASTQNNFPDQNGIQVDLTNPTFSARIFTFNCVQSSDTIANLTNTYFALFTLLKIQGTYSIYNDFVNMAVYAFYQKQANLTPPFRNSKGGVSIKFDLIFGETDPFANIPNLFLVDDQNRFLTP